MRAALDALAPDAILVEGPPDAADLVALAADPTMRPPVALLVYPPEAPEQAVFYPFAEFSPEWQAIRFGLERKVPVRFMDLPVAMRVTGEKKAAGYETEEAAPAASEQEGEERSAAGAADDEPEPFDPLARLAEAAGYEDRELWWEQEIERRQDPLGLFDGIREAMQAMRAEAPPLRPSEARREAHMRQAIRATLKEGRQRVAVVCGAWHAPALADLGPARPDADLLKGLRKTKVTATWVPWTYGRLSYRSGYGAGVTAPGWYHHIWASPDRAAIRWAAEAARLMRGEDLPAPSASVIELVRLAEALAGMRGLQAPGLAELNESIVTVLCGGDATPLRLIRERLEVGSRLGEVPTGVPTVPLRQDLADAQRSLRLKPSAESKPLDLDLRGDIDRQRSRLLHRLNLLGISWGQRRNVGGKAGTFHELWDICWRPELEVDIVEASAWGHTIEGAAESRARELADEATDLPVLTQLLDAVILCELPGAVAHVLRRVEDIAAVGAHVLQLMEALPPLARVARYGDVRATPRVHVATVIDGLLARVVVGLPGACSVLDDDAAAKMVDGLAHVTSSLELLERAEDRGAWRTLLDGLAMRGGVHTLVRGYACRLLIDQRALAPEEIGRRASLALSPAVAAPEAAAWLEGLLRGSGLVLLHEDALWTALDDWILALSPTVFEELLPLIRRAFAGFTPPERRTMGDKVKHLRSGGAGVAASGAAGIEERHDEARAARVLPVLARILGGTP